MKFTFKLSLILTVLIVFTSLSGAQPMQPNPILDETTIMRLGLEARIDPQLRNQRAQELATLILKAKTETVHGLMRPIQEALLLLCDRRVLATLQRDTMRMIDDALEKHITIEEVDRSVRLDRLSYVYGFFNHDVKPSEIVKYRDQWASLSLEEKAPRYPTYIHIIDLVCKPLSVGPLDSPQQTAEALELAAPLLKQMVTQPPRPGTAFHEPSHAALVLGPFYERWADTDDYGAIIKKHLGEPEAFYQMLAQQLVGAQDDPLKLDKMQHAFYAYSGRYLANTLARLNARATAPILKKTLSVYEKTGAAPASIQYTKRALVALGDKDARAEFEKTLSENSDLSNLAWLARNGQGETLQYALKHLGAHLNADPAHAIKAYFEKQLEALN